MSLFKYDATRLTEDKLNGMLRTLHVLGREISKRTKLRDLMTDNCEDDFMVKLTDAAIEHSHTLNDLIIFD